MYLFQPNTNHAEGTRPYLHKSMKQFITLICAGLLMSSCATIFCGSKTKVTFDGEISEKATLTIDGMKHTNVTFPYTTKIRRSFDDDDDVGLTPGDQVFDEENVATDGDFDGYSIENEDGEEDDFFSTGDDDEFEGSDNDLFDGIDDEF